MVYLCSILNFAFKITCSEKIIIRNIEYIFKKAEGGGGGEKRGQSKKRRRWFTILFLT